MDCTTGKIMLKHKLNKPTGTGFSKQFFFIDVRDNIQYVSKSLTTFDM